MSFLPGFEPEVVGGVDDGRMLLIDRFPDAAYFDIETTGLGAECPITVIACLYRNELHTFVRGRNLDGFLQLLEEAPVLVSYNGTNFDVPRILNTFHIPKLVRPHVDLRPLCKAEGLKGGLKQIEKTVGIVRPESLQGMSGADAELLWKLWTLRTDEVSLTRLLRYCGMDVLALRTLALWLIRRRAPGYACAADVTDWGLLEKVSALPLESSAGHDPLLNPTATASDDRQFQRLVARARKSRPPSPA